MPPFYNCKMASPKITIIVPVYNSAKYLHQCINSILSQTFADFELILVDDGSLDTSLAICDEFGKKDKRVIVLHKSNGGVSSARNFGLDVARGEYIGFVDSDDWIEPNMYEMLYSKASCDDADIVSCALITNKTVRVKPNTTLQDKFISCPVYMHSFCNKIVKKNLYIDNNIRIPENLVVCEDLFTLFRLFIISRKAEYLDEAMYHYRVNSNSLSHSTTIKHIESDICSADMLEKFLIERNIYAEYSSFVLYRKFISKLSLLTNKECYDYDRWLGLYPESNRHILKYHLNFAQLVVGVCATVGLKYFVSFALKMKNIRFIII